jgi:hypothetical protein
MPPPPHDKTAQWPKRPALALILDCILLTTAVIGANGLLLLLAWLGREHRELDNGARYLIAIGPANALIALLSLACTPIYKRLSRRRSAREHILLSVLIPVMATVAYAVVLMMKDTS